MLKLLLTAAIPFQRLVDKTSPTHAFINHQALAILKADGREREAQWLEWYLPAFNAGCDDADDGWKNVGHMYDPSTGTGLKGWPSAPQVMREAWNLAVQSLRQSDPYGAAFHLGAAAHLVQDLCVPHHAAARVFAGHRRFEAYAERHRQRFAVHRDGLYHLARTPEGWVIHNADYTRTHYSHCLSASTGPAEVDGAVADLLPRAQRSTAGFIAFFLETMGVA